MENMETTQRIFKIPIWIPMHLETLDPNNPLRGRVPRWALFEGKDCLQAISKLIKEKDFWRNYNNLPRDERKGLTPFRLDNDRKIIPILPCERRHKNREGEYTCGTPVSKIDPGGELDTDLMAGEFGYCCIDGGYAPDLPDCPYNSNRV